MAIFRNKGGSIKSIDIEATTINHKSKLQSLLKSGARNTTIVSENTDKLSDEDERQEHFGIARGSIETSATKNVVSGTWESAFSSLSSLGDCMSQCHSPCFASQYMDEDSRTQPPSTPATTIAARMIIAIDREKEALPPSTGLQMRSYLRQVSSWDSETGSEYGRFVGTPKLTREVRKELFRSNSNVPSFKIQKRNSESVSVDMNLYRSPAWSDTGSRKSAGSSSSTKSDDSSDYSIKHSTKRAKASNPLPKTEHVSELFSHFAISSHRSL